MKKSIVFTLYFHNNYQCNVLRSAARQCNVDSLVVKFFKNIVMDNHIMYDITTYYQYQTIQLLVKLLHNYFKLLFCDNNTTKEIHASQRDKLTQ